jgi:hypothetical protein
MSDLTFSDLQAQLYQLYEALPQTVEQLSF